MARRRRKKGGHRRHVRSTFSSLAGLSGRDPFDFSESSSHVPWVWIGVGAAALMVLMKHAPNQGAVGDFDDLGAYAAAAARAASSRAAASTSRQSAVIAAVRSAGRVGPRMSAPPTRTRFGY